MSMCVRFSSAAALLLGALVLACSGTNNNGASSSGAGGGAPSGSGAGAGGKGGAGSASAASSGAGGASNSAASSSGAGGASGSVSSGSGAGGASNSAASSGVASSSAASSGVASSSAASSGVSSSSVASSSAVSSSSSGGNPNRKPCTHGPGFIAFSFHYQPGPGTQAFLDEYGLPDSSNWQADPVFSTSVVDNANGGGLEIASGNWILIRYSVAGLSQIQSATFSIYGRSYDVSASGSFNAWSPLYGDAPSPTNSVSNAWPYTWTTIDYTGHVNVGDSPGLTGIRLYSGPNSDDLAIHAVELCIEGS